MPCPRFADAGLGGQPGGSRVAHLAREKDRRRAPHDDGVRSRSRRARRHCSMLSGRALAARLVRQNEIEIVREDERLKRFTGLRAAQHAGHVRSNQGFIPRARATFGTRTWKPCDLEHVESGAKRKSVRRLEPERRTQDHDLRLLSPRQGRADRFNAGNLGRSRQLFEKEKSRSPEILLRQDSRSRRKNA